MKARWSLVPWKELSAVVDCLTVGQVKHGDSWKSLDASVHFDAAMRHITEYRLGTNADVETGLHPLTHAIVRLLFCLWLASQERNESGPA